MSAFLNQRLTNGGWDALSIALGGGRLTFYKMQAGSGTIANDAAIMGMTALVAPVCDIPITSYVIEGDGQITLFGNINSSELTAGFTFKELGVFATIEAPVGGKGGTPSGPNIQAITRAPSASPTSNPVVPPPVEGTALMYSYCNSYDASDYIPGSGETSDVTNTIQVTIKIDEAENVVINVLAGEQFAVVNIGPPSVGAGPWSYTTANVAYLKRLVAGPMTLIAEDTNTITIGQKQLTTDLDLYVANGNPDISPNFSSIQNALNYLGQYVIPTQIKARIHVSAGTYVSTNTILVDHPNAQSITIQGPQNTKQTGTSIVITGSANNWSLKINGIGDISKFKVNDWAIVDSVVGVTSNNHALVCGFFKVTTVAAGTVTLLVPNPKASFSVTGLTSISVTPISVILTNSVVNRTVILIGSYGIQLFQYIGIIPTLVPTLLAYPTVVWGKSNFVFVGVAGFNSVINAAGNNPVMAIFTTSALSLQSCASTDNQCGIAGTSSAAITVRSSAFTYNNFKGFWMEGGGASFGYEPTYIGGNYFGMISTSNAVMSVIASIPTGYVFSHCNDYWGLWCYAGGAIVFTSPACTLNMINNGLSQPTHYDVVAQNYGLVSGNVCIIGSRIFNSPVGTINSSGGLIN